ncbi:MAG: transcriptional repressor [Propionibacteriaceae bacterium]|nr:transcriptional repressor [Propionibacteriaceae bacterium]
MNISQHSVTSTPDTARSSRGRQLVGNALQQCREFVTAQQLHAMLDQQLGLATVYRNLQALVAAGKADTVRTDSGEVAYRHCSTEHHHHLICRDCGTANEITAESVESWAAATAAQYGYQLIGHTAEVYGVCPQCIS